MNQSGQTEEGRRQLRRKYDQLHKDTEECRNELRSTNESTETDLFHRTDELFKEG
jgi:hypothetical protein